MFYDNDPCDNHDGAFDTRLKDTWLWSDTDDNALDSMTEDMVITMRAGQLRALLAWRPLTEDPATWPKEGQLVAVVDAEKKWVTPDANASAVYWNHRSATYGWTHWLPLPLPLPKGESK